MKYFTCDLCGERLKHSETEPLVLLVEHHFSQDHNLRDDSDVKPRKVMSRDQIVERIQDG